jgi:hypothetical protein
MKKLALVCVSVLFVVCAQAATPAHIAKINKLFEVLQMQKLYEAGLQAQVDAMNRMMPMEGMTADQRAKMEASMKKVKDLMLTEIGWAKVKDEFVNVYASHISEDEADKIIKLLDSETGKLFVSKQLVVVPESSTIVQSKTQALAPKIMAIMMQDAAK